MLQYKTKGGEKMKKKILLPSALGLSLISAIVFATSSAGAQSPLPGTQTIIQRIAQRFNLNQADVQKVFDEQKTEILNQKRSQLETRLNQAVADGKITQVQKQAILDKFGQMKSSMWADKKQLHNITPEQRQQAKAQKQQELQTWAQQNGLNPQTLQDLIGHGAKGFGIKGFGHGVQTPSPAQ